jgi:4-amino-4-deoxy-L-arabinose transferase-like glycosyltransferase
VAALDPNLIAHGQLATTDAGATCFCFLAIYAFWRLLHCPSNARLVVTGLATGLALASKFSAVVVIPGLALLGFLHLAAKRAEGARREGRRLLGWLLVICLIAMAVLIADYGGEFRSVWAMVREMRTVEQGSLAPPSAGPVADFMLTRLPIPVPSYWYGLWLVRHDIQSGRATFFWGQRSEGGWWYYFPAALLIKTPLATLILVGAGLILLLKPGRCNWGHLAFLALPAAAWMGIAMASRLNLGYRHILPIWPFLFVAVGSLAAVPPIGWRRAALLALTGWLAVSAIAIFPHHLAYFNELVGGPGEGYRYLVDSNLDWGQDLKGLARYQREHALGQIYLAYFGTADPDTYGIEYECMPSYGLLACDDAPIPRSGTLAVSATCLQGGCTEDPQAYRWLLDETPVAKIGYSIFVYELP